MPTLPVSLSPTTRPVIPARRAAQALAADRAGKTDGCVNALTPRV